MHVHIFVDAPGAMKCAIASTRYALRPVRCCRKSRSAQAARSLGSTVEYADAAPNGAALVCNR